LLYRTTHINHPSAVWVRQSDKNYIWLLQLLDALCKEYTYRYGKVHKVEREGLLKQLHTLPTNISLGEFGAASLLAFGDQSTIPMLMFSLISRPGGDNYGMALAVAFILIVITTVIVFAVGSEPKREFRKPRRMKQTVPSLPL
jgi:hypothetical protein